MESRYEDLNTADQKILAEYDNLYKSLTKRALWDDFNLQEHTIVLISKDSLRSYMINADNASNGIFTKEIKLPKEHPPTLE